MLGRMVATSQTLRGIARCQGVIALRFAAALVAAVAATSAQQGEQATVRLRSLAPFAVPSQQRAVPLLSAMPGSDGDNSQRLDAAGEPSSTAWVVQLLNERCRAALETGRFSIAQAGNRLVLRGRAGDVAACDRELDAIAAAVGRPIEVTVWRLPLADGPLPATVWDAPTLQRMLQHTVPLWSARGRTRSGGALRLGQERGIGCLRDIDVEMTDATRITDPKIGLAFAGARASLVVQALPGDELLLTGTWLLSEPVALREQSLGEGQSTVDLPEHRTATVSFAGRIGSGGALVVAGRGGPVGPDGFALVVGARYLAPPAAGIAQDLVVWPVGALLAGDLAWRPQLAWRMQPGDDGPTFERFDQDGGLTGDDLLSLLAAEPPTTALLDGGVLVLQGDVEGCRRGEARLRELFAGLRTVALRASVVGDGVPALEIVQPGLADRMASAFVGRERAVVRDFEVEVANQVRAGNPVIDCTYSGLWLHATIVPVANGWHTAGLWTVAAYDEPRQRLHDETPPMRLQLVDYRATATPWDASMAVDQDQVLGDGPAWTVGGAATRITVRLSMP